jgi:hypothetical protein
MIIILNYNFPFIILLLLLKAGVVPWYLNLSWLIYVLGYLVLTARLRSLVLQEMKTLIAVTPFIVSSACFTKSEENHSTETMQGNRSKAEKYRSKCK